MKPCGRTAVYLLPRNGWGKQHGLVAEWLGSALQKLLQRFESAPDLRKKGPAFAGPFSFPNGASRQGEQVCPKEDKTMRMSETPTRPSPFTSSAQGPLPKAHVPSSIVATGLKLTAPS